MKRIVSIAAFATIVLVFVAASPQEKQEHRMDSQKHMQLMEMMKDSAIMNTMMDHIASNRNMSSMMMGKMIRHAQSDSSMMSTMCGMTLHDQSMHSLMLNMMMGGGGMMQHDGMVNHGSSQMKPLDRHQGMMEGHSGQHMMTQ